MTKKIDFIHLKFSKTELIVIIIPTNKRILSKHETGRHTFKILHVRQIRKNL